tara:strand:+ start:145 stop:654 length:510 start_codon:yes stop_codon:yes gene_type:complete
MDWNEYFIGMLYHVAKKSKDQSTNIGAIIVGLDNEIRSTGYNSFPRGIKDDIPERQERPEKYFWFEHAERNAIYNAARIGVSTNGCKMYTFGIPCSDGCSRAVIQAGINQVIVHQNWIEKVEGIDVSGRTWENDRSIKMFHEAGVRVTLWRGNIPNNLEILYGEKIITP